MSKKRIKIIALSVMAILLVLEGALSYMATLEFGVIYTLLIGSAPMFGMTLAADSRCKSLVSGCVSISLIALEAAAYIDQYLFCWLISLRDAFLIPQLSCFLNFSALLGYTLFHFAMGPDEAEKERGQ